MASKDEVNLLEKAVVAHVSIKHEILARFLHGFFIGLEQEFGRFFSYFAFLKSAIPFRDRAKLFLLKWLHFILT